MISDYTKITPPHPHTDTHTHTPHTHIHHTHTPHTHTHTHTHTHKHTHSDTQANTPWTYLDAFSVQRVFIVTIKLLEYQREGQLIHRQFIIRIIFSKALFLNYNDKNNNNKALHAENL